MGNPLCTIGQLYFYILIARAITSWFPLSPGSPFEGIVRFLHAVTEPVLAPLRRVIPPVGMFDLSFLVLIFGLQILLAAIGC